MVIEGFFLARSLASLVRTSIIKDVPIRPQDLKGS